MAYGAKSSDIKDVSYLSHGLHEVTFKPVFHGLVKNKDGSKEFDVLDIIWASKQGEYQYRMFNPELGEESKRDKNEAKYSKILVYVAAKITGKEVEMPSTVVDWLTMKQWFITTIGTNYTTTPYILKLTGNVYQGNASVGITEGYFGWLDKKLEGGKVPVISAREAAQNKEYDEFQAKKAGAGSAANEAKDAASDEPVF